MRRMLDTGYGVNAVNAEFCSMVDGCDIFSRFFQQKIDKFLVNLHRTTAVDPEPGDTPCLTASIEGIEPTTTATNF